MYKFSLAMAAFLMVLPSVQAATIQVDRLDDDPTQTTCSDAPIDCSLRGAIVFAELNPGPDVVLVPADTFTIVPDGNGGTDVGDLDINSEITIRGAGMSETIITPAPGSGNGRAFDLASDGVLILEDLTIRGFHVGTLAGGGAISINDSVQSSATLRRVGLIQNEANIGGAISIGSTGDPGEPVRLTITDSVISENRVDTEIILDCFGGALSLGAPTVVENTLFESNQAPAGGAICIRGHSLALTGVTFVENSYTPNGSGGALYALDSEITGQDVTFTNNGAVSGSGGAILARGGSLDLRDALLANNRARSAAVQLSESNETTLEDTQMIDNSIIQIRASDSFLALENTHLNGTSQGIVLIDSPLNASNISVTNHSRDVGAGVYGIGSVVIIEQCRFTNNHAAVNNFGFSGVGGAIYLDGGAAQIRRCTFDGNQADGGGAALAMFASTIVLLDNLTFSNNGAPDGSAIQLSNVPESLIKHVTIADSSGGSVITLLNSSTRMENNAIDGNCELFFGGGTTESNDWSVLTDTSCLATGAMDDVVTDLQLLPLSASTDSIPVYLARPGSPVLDASEDNCGVLDQRGFRRPDVCDAGAVEHQPGENEQLHSDGFESGM